MAEKDLSPEEVKAQKAAEKAERDAKAEATAAEKEMQAEAIKAADEFEKKLKEDKEKESELEKRGSVDVKKRDGQYIRTYSKALHGKEFLEKARGFAKKNGYVVV